MLLSIAQLANKYSIIPLKRMGQNFIFDHNICDKIAKHSIINEHSSVLEIGPGTAGLTRSILKFKPKKFVVIDNDTRCIPLLDELKLYFPCLEIKYDNALNVHLASLGASTTKLDIISNLPYNIGSKLLMNWMYQIQYINSMTLMFQQEVADRIVSQHNKKSYGRLSVICQILCNVHKCFNLSPQVFYPEPKIYSTVVRLIPKHNIPSAEILIAIEKITHLAFSGRRKMIKSSLKSLHGQITKILCSLDIDPESRAENLLPIDYLNIARKIVN